MDNTNLLIFTLEFDEFHPWFVSLGGGHQPLLSPQTYYYLLPIIKNIGFYQGQNFSG